MDCCRMLPDVRQQPLPSVNIYGRPLTSVNMSLAVVQIWPGLKTNTRRPLIFIQLPASEATAAYGGTNNLNIQQHPNASLCGSLIVFGWLVSDLKV